MLIAIGLVASCGNAQTSVEANIKKLIEPRLGDGVKVDSIRKTPYSGLYEIRAAGDILYTDEKAEFIFVGNVFQAKTARNLTKERVDEINKIKFSDLPLQHALKTVKGNGKRTLAIFEDPNCGYCKRFRQTTLTEIDNVTVYTFMLNILSEDSIVKSRNIWCSADRNKAWDEWMVGGKAAAAAPARCKAPHEEVAELGRKLRINGTPAIFFADGSRIPGAIDAKALETKLATIK
jgi:thiol:disulfide interchange protein DsbC